MWDYRCYLDPEHPDGGVIDGDTIVIVVDQGFDDRKHRLSLRLFGVDTPEKSDPRWAAARQFTVDWINANKSGAKGYIYVKTVRLPDDSHEKMTFARYVGLVFDMSARYCLNTAIVEAGHAK